MKYIACMFIYIYIILSILNMPHIYHILISFADYIHWNSKKIFQYNVYYTYSISSI